MSAVLDRFVLILLSPQRQTWKMGAWAPLASTSQAGSNPAGAIWAAHRAVTSKNRSLF